MDDQDQQEGLHAEENGACHGTEADEDDDEPCVETGRSLINSLLEDSEAQMPSDFVDEAEESDNEEKFIILPGPSDEGIGAVVKVEEDENGLEMQAWPGSFDAEEYNFEEGVSHPSSIDDSIEAVAGASVGVVKTSLDAQNLHRPDFGNEIICPPDIFAQVKSEREGRQNALDALNAAYLVGESTGPGPSSREEPPLKKSMGELTELWLLENCVANRDFCMPRGEIYAVYVDDLRSKHDSTSFSITVFCQYMKEIFPEVNFRRNEFMVEAVGVRLATSHSLAPSSTKWAPVDPKKPEEEPVDEEMTDEEDGEGEEEGSPVERLTMRWIKLNCIADANITTPRGELYAAYIQDLRNEHCALSGSLRLFGNVMKRVFPTAQLRKVQVMVYIKGVKYVGAHKLQRSISKRWRMTGGKLTNSILEAHLDTTGCAGNETDLQMKNKDGDTILMDRFGDEAQFSGDYAQRNGDDSTEISLNVEKPFHCLECPKTFADSFSLTIHTRQHSRERREQKTMQKQTTAQKKSLLGVDEAGPSKDPQLCYIASSVKPSIHQGIKAYECPFCGRLCCSPSSLQLHLKVHNNKRPTECSICHRNFKSPAALNGHMNAHNSKPSSLQCEETPDAIARVKPFQCELCGNRFADTFNLTLHKYRHTREGLTADSSIEGNDSDIKNFPTINPDPHVPTVGTYLTQMYQPIIKKERKKEPSLVCKFCPHTAKNSSNLAIHMRKHTGKKPFKCDVCPKKFASKGILKVHRKIHERRYQCSVCHKGYEFKSALRKHITVKKHWKMEEQEDSAEMSDHPVEQELREIKTEV